jgi:hypothetical protein
MKMMAKEECDCSSHSFELQTEIDRRDALAKALTKKLDRENAHRSVRSVEATQRWLFNQGGQMENLSAFLQGYGSLLGEQGLPVDRLVAAGTDDIAWKWEPQGVVVQELDQGLSDDLEAPVRRRPESSQYTDYLAMPIRHCGRYCGGVAYSTLNPDGFTREQIQFFEATHAGLSTVLRLHMSEMEKNMSVRNTLIPPR